MSFTHCAMRHYCAWCIRLIFLHVFRFIFVLWFRVYIPGRQTIRIHPIWFQTKCQASAVAVYCCKSISRWLWIWIYLFVVKMSVVRTHSQVCPCVSLNLKWLNSTLMHASMCPNGNFNLSSNFSVHIIPFQTVQCKGKHKHNAIQQYNVYRYKSLVRTIAMQILQLLRCTTITSILMEALTFCTR